MTQFIRTQSAAGAGTDFNGSAGTGLFLFSQTNLPTDEKIICRQLGFYGVAATATYIMVYFEPVAPNVGAPILVAAIKAASLVGLDGHLAATVCPGEVPRSSNGQFWQLKVYSDGLSAPATATLAYDTERCCL